MKKLVGLHASVGFASTKTLSKIAIEQAKVLPEYEGVRSLLDVSEQEMDEVLSMVGVEDIWGIGRRSAIKLQLRGIMTARQLRDADIAHIRTLLGVVGVRIVLELRGMECLPLETHLKPKQGIMSSQSFSRPIEQLAELEEAVSTYASTAARKLRTQHALTGQVSVFIHTNYFNQRVPQYAASTSLMLAFPTAFTPDLIDAAKTCIKSIYKGGYQFKKAGVYLTHLTPDDVLQADLFGAFSFEAYNKKQRLMQMMDECNAYYGRDTLYYGAIGMKREWQMRQSRKSPNYTTRWQDLVVTRTSPP